MLTKIELKINAADSDFKDLDICINEQQVEYSVYNNSVLISCNLDMGIHQLSVQLINGTRINIDDVRINSASLRHTIYLSYIQTASGDKLNPSTVLWDNSQKWILPFGNPVSYWISLTTSKIQPGDWGKNLYEIYNIIYPSKIKIRSEFPQVVKDFFEHNFDFYCKSAGSVNFLPQCKSNLDISGYDIQALSDEIESNYQWFVENQRKVAQKYYNDREWPDNYANWLSVTIYKDGKFVNDKLPLLQSFVKNLPINNIQTVFVGILEPGAAVAPHCDKSPNHVPGKEGCNRLYIPLKWSPKNYLKFASGGLIDSAVPYIINNTDHVHALINASDQNRIILSIILDPEQNLHLLA